MLRARLWAGAEKPWKPLCQVLGGPIPVQLLLRGDVCVCPCPQLGPAGFSRHGLAQHQDQLLKPALVQVPAEFGSSWDQNQSQWFSTASQGTRVKVWRHSWLSQPPGQGFLRASSEQRPEMVPNAVRCSGQLRGQVTFWCRMSVVLGLRSLC